MSVADLIYVLLGVMAIQAVVITYAHPTFVKDCACKQGIFLFDDKSKTIYKHSVLVGIVLSIALYFGIVHYFSLYSWVLVAALSACILTTMLYLFNTLKMQTFFTINNLLFLPATLLAAFI